MSDAVRQGHRFLRQQLSQILATCTDVLSPRMVRIARDVVADWAYLAERIDSRVTNEIEGLAQTDVSCEQLTTVRGVEIRCVWISMVARSNTLRSTGRIRMRETSNLLIGQIQLASPMWTHCRAAPSHPE